MKKGFLVSADKHKEGLGHFHRLLYEQISDGRVWIVGGVKVSEIPCDDTDTSFIQEEIRYKMRAVICLANAYDAEIGEDGLEPDNPIITRRETRIVHEPDFSYEQEYVESEGRIFRVYPSLLTSKDAWLRIAEWPEQ